MAIVGFATVVWRVAISFQKTEDRTGVIEKKIDRIERTQITKSDVSNIVDSLLQPVLLAQDGLRRSYVRYLRNDSTLKLTDFIEYMNGIEWTVAPAARDSIKVKVKIEKIPKR